MSRSTVLAILLTIPLTAGLRWTDLGSFLCDEILSAAEDSGSAPSDPPNNKTDGGPGMDPWG